MKSRSRLAFAFTALILPAFSQPSAGTIAGSVVGADAVPVPGATITFSDPKAGTKLSATSGADGAFRVSPAPSGSYDLSVHAAGFREYSRFGIRTAGTPLRMEIRLFPEKDDLAAAIPQLQAAVTAKPGDAIARLRLGRAYASLGQLDKAREQYGKALESAGSSLPLEYALAQLAVRERNARTAMMYVHRMRTSYPESEQAKVLEADIYMRMGLGDEAAAALDQMLKADPNDTDALILVGSLAVARKRFTEAEEPFRRAYALDPSNIRALQGLAEIQFRSNQPAKAVELLGVESARHPERPEVRRELARAELRAGQFDKALADCRPLLDQFKTSPKDQGDVMAIMGGAYDGLGDLAHAVECLHKSTELVPESPAYRVNLASLYERTGKNREALTEYRTALKEDPDNAPALNNVAFLMAETGGDLDEALRLAQLARRQMGDSDEVMDTLGWIYYKKQLTDSAVQILTDLVRKRETNPMYHYHLAAALLQKGDREEATKQLNLALQNKPNPEDLARINEMLSAVNQHR